MLRAALIALTLMLGLALADLPYGYYQFLRVAATGILIWLLVAIWDQTNTIERLALMALAISYNPLFKIHMDREIHAVANILTVVIMAIEYLRHRHKIDAV